MFNRERTKQVFGYDLNPDKHSRRSEEAFQSTNKCLKKHLIVIDNCPSCNEERQIQYRASKKNKPCYRCFHNSPDMINAKKNQIKTKSEQTRQKMIDNHWSVRGLSSPFKGKQHNTNTKQYIADIAKKQSDKVRDKLGKEEYAVTMACMSQKIKREEFKEFTTPLGVAIRQSPEGKIWTYDVLAKANFTCQKCNAKGVPMHAHHINGFNLFPDQRFAVDNGVCLCENCHVEFHDIYGRGNNTKSQYDEWSNIKHKHKHKHKHKQNIYLLIGAPASGKSWVAQQLLNQYNYISYDSNPKKIHLDLLKSESDKPILYDPTFKISTMIRRYSNEFNFILMAIHEDESILKERILKRGGEWTNTIVKRNTEIKKRFQKYGKNGFIGTSSEVLEFLKQIKHI